MASVTDCEVGNVNYILGDSHVYEAHFEITKSQLERIPKRLPKIRLNQTHDDIEKYTWEDIELIDYNSDSFIKYPFPLGERTQRRFSIPSVSNLSLIIINPSASN